MEFVNIHGKTVVVPDAKDKKSAPKAPSKPKSEVYHKGWIVTGHSPEQVAEYKAKLGSEPFDLLIFARRVKFKKVRAKPYESSEAAQTCVDMAIKGGWLNVESKPVVKGEK